MLACGTQLEVSELICNPSSTWLVLYACYHVRGQALFSLSTFACIEALRPCHRPEAKLFFLLQLTLLFQSVTSELSFLNPS